MDAGFLSVALRQCEAGGFLMVIGQVQAQRAAFGDGVGFGLCDSITLLFNQEVMSMSVASLVVAKPAAFAAKDLPLDRPRKSGLS